MYNMGTSNLLAYRHSLTMIKGFLFLVLMLFSLISRGQVEQDQTDTIESYLTAIDDLEAELGAYSTQLSDLYSRPWKILRIKNRIFRRISRVSAWDANRTS